MSALPTFSPHCGEISPCHTNIQYYFVGELYFPNHSRFITLCFSEITFPLLRNRRHLLCRCSPISSQRSVLSGKAMELHNHSRSITLCLSKITFPPLYKHHNSLCELMSCLFRSGQLFLAKLWSCIIKRLPIFGSRKSLFS